MMGEGEMAGEGEGGGGPAFVIGAYTPSGITAGIHVCALVLVVSETRAYSAGEPDCRVRALRVPEGTRGMPSSGVAMSHSLRMSRALEEVYSPPM